MHKSIFEKLKQNFSNPVDEYLKISRFVYEKQCYHSYTIRDCFFKLFPHCVALRKYYSDYSECINENVGILRNYSYSIGNDVFNGFLPETKDEIYDLFLTYVEIITCMLCVFKKCGPSIYGSNHINKAILDQLEEIIDTSLKSMNYVIEEKDTAHVIIRKIDPISEMVAEQSTPNMKTAILNYLSIRDKDIEGKEKALHDIIDLLEPSYKKFNSVSIIVTAKEFSQIIRHPEIMKEKEEYKWFISNKSIYLDQLFTLCVFTQQYVLSKEISDTFVEQKKNALKA